MALLALSKWVGLAQQPLLVGTRMDVNSGGARTEERTRSVVEGAPIAMRWSAFFYQANLYGLGDHGMKGERGPRR